MQSQQITVPPRNGATATAIEVILDVFSCHHHLFTLFSFEKRGVNEY